MTQSLNNCCDSEEPEIGKGQAELAGNGAGGHKTGSVVSETVFLQAALAANSLAWVPRTAGREPVSTFGQLQPHCLRNKNVEMIGYCSIEGPKDLL